ncbi:hypothetical protein JOQ06_003673, partial [Pogonophryne albipinna]
MWAATWKGDSNPSRHYLPLIRASNGWINKCLFRIVFGERIVPAVLPLGAWLELRESTLCNTPGGYEEQMSCLLPSRLKSAHTSLKRTSWKVEPRKLQGREDVGEKVAEEAENIEAQQRESDEEHRGEEEVTVIHVTLIEGNPHPSYVICLFEDARLLPGLFVLDGKEWNLRKSMFETLLSRPEWALKPTFTTFWKM